MSSSTHILAVDLGTGGVKTVLFNSDLQIVSTAFEACETTYPKPSWAEQMPEEWWAAFIRTTRKVVAEGGIQPEQVGVIAIDAMTPVLVAVDEEGAALRPAIIWMDRRAEKECTFIDQELSQELNDISGNHNDPSNFAPKAMWFRDNEPELYAKTHKLLHANGFLVHKLTAQFTMDRTQCGLSQLCHTAKGEWSDELIKGCDLDRDKLPEIFESTDIVGKLTEKAGLSLGLPSGVPVIAGSMDNVAAGLGLGVHKPGEVFVSAGTATNVCLCTDNPNYNPSFHLYSHILPNQYFCVGAVDYGGAGLKWFREILEEADYEELDRLAKQCEYDTRRPLVFLPYMVGQRAPFWNSNTRGVLFGLSPAVKRDVLARTFMEGNAMGVNRILGMFGELGHEVSSFKFTGGAAESSVYSQIFSDVTGCKMGLYGEKDVATLGIAIAGAFAIELYSSIDEIVEKMEPKRVVEPSDAKKAYYADLQALYVSLCEKLKPEFDMLAEIKKRHSLRHQE